MANFGRNRTADVDDAPAEVPDQEVAAAETRIADVDDAPAEVPDQEVAAAETRIAVALAATENKPAEIDPWAFLASEGAIAEVSYVKAPPIETDIPLALRNLAEQALTAGTALRVTFPNADLVKPALKHFKAYAMCRVAGKIVIRAGVQRDTVTIHLTAKHPTVKPVEVAAPVEDSSISE